jgi:RsmE family RNA methyltransferase
MNLILCEPDEVDANGLVTLSGPRATHVREVLRAAVGDEVRVGIIDGARGRGKIVAIGAARDADHGVNRGADSGAEGGADSGARRDGERDAERDSVALQCVFEEAMPPRPAVDLLLALPRPKVMRRLWAQLAALGVGRIVLTNAARVERHYFDTHILSQATYRPLLLEGLQQARDTRLPLVSIHRQFRILVEDDLDHLSDADLRLLAHPGAAPPISTLVAAASAAGKAAGKATAGRVLLAVGPEGGWNDFELNLLQRHRFQPVALGPRTLRTDTACIALLALIQAALDQR